MEWHIVYAKFDGCKGFKAFDVNEGRQVGNLIYASLVENTEDTRTKLQKGVPPYSPVEEKGKGEISNNIAR